MKKLEFTPEENAARKVARNAVLLHAFLVLAGLFIADALLWRLEVPLPLGDLRLLRFLLYFMVAFEVAMMEADIRGLYWGFGIETPLKRIRWSVLSLALSTSLLILQLWTLNLRLRTLRVHPDLYLSLSHLVRQEQFLIIVMSALLALGFVVRIVCAIRDLRNQKRATQSEPSNPA